MLCRSSNGSTSTSDGTIVKKILLLIGLVLLTSARATPLDADQLSPHELKPERQQAAAAYLATEVLTRFHYKPKPLNKAQSEKIFDQYLKSLDPEKSFFVQSDIDQMSGYRSGLGEAIIEENLAAPSPYSISTPDVSPSDSLMHAACLSRASTSGRRKAINMSVGRQSGQRRKVKCESCGANGSKTTG